MKNGEDTIRYDKIINSSTTIVINREQVESFYNKSLAQVDGLISVFEKYGSN
jgi:hypothetical protein